MSDDQGEPLEQPELLSVAEVLTEHAETTIRAAWLKQAGRQHLEIPESYVHVSVAEEAFRAAWRAAVEWYIGLSPVYHGVMAKQVTNPERGSPSWWRHEAQLAREDGHPEAALAAMAQSGAAEPELRAYAKLLGVDYPR